MMRRFGPHWQLISAPWRQRYTEKTYGGIIAMAILMLFVGWILAVAKSADAPNWLEAFSRAAAAFILILWMLQIQAFVQYNHPTHARLVPGNLRKMREAIVGLWLACSALCGLLIGVAFGNTGNWFLASAVCMVFLLTSFVWPALWVAGFFFPWWLDFGFTDFVRQTAIPFYEAWPVFCGSVALLLCAGVLTHVVVRSGSEKHQKAFERMRRVRWSMMPNADGRQATLHHWGVWGTRLLRVVLYPLHRYTHHLLRHPNSTPSSTMARAELVFGADVHWVMQVSVAAGVALLALVGCTAAFVYWGSAWSETLRPGWFGLAAGMLFITLTPVMGLHSAILRSKREQSLLMLLPGMPHGVALNRLLTARLFRQMALAWLAAALVASQLPFSPGAGTVVAAAYIGILPASGLLIQDWSRIQMQRPMRVVAIMVTVAIGPIACYFAIDRLQWDTAFLLLVSTVLAGPILYWRWQRMLTFQAALPAGRL